MIELTEEQQKQLAEIMSNVAKPTAIEFRAYYNPDGTVITYTTEDLPGEYIVITRDQYAEARPDAKVIDKQLSLTNRQTHVAKLEKNKTTGIKTSKYDVSVITDGTDSVYYSIKAYAIN